MDISESIRGRRSARAFKNRRVSTEITDKLIVAARWAPSAGSIQPWEFVVRDEEVQEGNLQMRFRSGIHQGSFSGDSGLRG